MTEALLILNTGSSSIKFQVFEVLEDRLERKLKGLLDGIQVRPHLEVKNAAGETVLDRDLEAHAEDVGSAVAHVLDFLTGEIGDGGLIAAGHRVVHGGRRFDKAVRVDDATLPDIEAL